MVDVVVVVGGPAGLSAALILGRCRRRVLLLDLGRPRNRSSHALHGYLTRDGIAPSSFVELGRAELVQYGVEQRAIGDRRAAGRRSHRVSLSDGTEVDARYLLIATGVVDESWPFQDSATATADRFSLPSLGWLGAARPASRRLPRRRRRGSLGLKTWSADIVVYRTARGWRCCANARPQRDPSATEPIAQPTRRRRAVAVVLPPAIPPRDALFFATAQHPQSSLAIALGCAVTRRGTVQTGNACDTNVPRLYVAGDASRDAQFVVVAAAEGVKAACAINKALQLEELKP